MELDFLLLFLLGDPLVSVPGTTFLLIFSCSVGFFFLFFLKLLINVIKESTKNPAIVSIDEEKVMKWLNNGAIPSDTVRNILSKEGIMKKFADAKKSK